MGETKNLLETKDTGSSGGASGDNSGDKLIKDVLNDQVKLGNQAVGLAVAGKSTADKFLPELVLVQTSDTGAKTPENVPGLPEKGPSPEVVPATPEVVPQAQRAAIKPGDTTPMPDGSWNVRNADGSETKHQTDGSIINVKDGRVKSVTNPLGVSKNFEYDKDGNLVTINGSKPWDDKAGDKATVDEHGNYTIRTKDGASATYKTDGSFVTQTADGKTIKVSQPNGGTRTFERDDNGKITSITEPDNSTWRLGTDGQYHESKNGKDTGRVDDSTPEIDRNGNYKLTHKDGSSVVRKTDGSEVSYDKDRNVTKIGYQDGKTRSFDYTGGKLSAVHDTDGTDWVLDNVGNWRHEKNGANIGYTTQSLTVDGEGNFKRTDNTNGTYDLVNTKDQQLTYDPPAPNNVFGNSGDPLQSIKPDNVRQGELGDCYFESALASLAGTNPSAVQNMIKDNNDGTYTVTFPGDPSHPVLVQQPSVHELETYGHAGGDNSAWAAIIEKAHRQYTGKEDNDNGDIIFAGLDLLSPTGSKTYQLSNFGATKIAGLPVPTFGASSRSDVEQALLQATSGGRAVVASTASDLAQKFHLQNGSGSYVGGHAYSVTGYDPKTGMVTIRNPWGTDSHDHGNNGYFSMTLDEFMNTFTDMAVQNAQK